MPEVLAKLAELEETVKKAADDAERFNRYQDSIPTRLLS